MVGKRSTKPRRPIVSFSIASVVVSSILFAFLGIAEAQDPSASHPITLTEIRRLADIGAPNAQYMLGQMYEFGGKGVVQDYSEAARWYRRAAEQGEPYAQSGLGLMYFQGIAVPRDLVQSYKWLNLAVSRFENPERDAFYGQLFPDTQIEARNRFFQSLKEVQQATLKAREAVKRGMTASQIIEAQKLASAWKPAQEAKLQPEDLEHWSKIMRDVSRKRCAQGDQAACALADQRR